MFELESADAVILAQLPPLQVLVQLCFRRNPNWACFGVRVQIQF